MEETSGTERKVQSEEEVDLVNQSVKKSKRKAGDFVSNTSRHVVYDHEELAPSLELEEEGLSLARGSYRSILVGNQDKTCFRRESLEYEFEEEEEEDHNLDDDESEEDKDIKLEDEEIVTSILCLVLRISNRVRKRVSKPFRNSLIMHLLGKQVGFKILEHRLQQLWARMGVINLIDLGNEFFMVNFISQIDKDHALNEGP